jgi:hypothetical protein
MLDFLFLLECSARDYREPRNSTEAATARTVDGGTSPTTVTSDSPTRRAYAEVGPR